MWFSSIDRGDIVAPRKDLRVGWLGQRVPAGRRGIVHATHTSLLGGRRLEVEFGSGWTTMKADVAESDVRLVRRRGEGAWRRRRHVAIGVRLGLFVLSLPALVGAIAYLLRGGDPTLLVEALLLEAATFASALLMPVMPLGLVVVVVWLVMRRR